MKMVHIFISNVKIAKLIPWEEIRKIEQQIELIITAQQKQCVFKLVSHNICIHLISNT